MTNSVATYNSEKFMIQFNAYRFHNAAVSFGKAAQPVSQIARHQVPDTFKPITGDQVRFRGAARIGSTSDSQDKGHDPAIHNCRVCGLKQKDPPWGESGFEPTYDICPCCSTEFGLDDRTSAQRFEVRGHWIKSGYPWFHPEQKPPDWDPDAQMAQIPEEFLLHSPD